jgi:hypothetical protein
LLSWDNLGSAPGQNYSIYRRKFVLLLAKGLSCYPLDLIALVGFANVFFGYNETQTGNSQIVGSCENQEVWVRCPDRSVSEDSRKKRLVKKALIFAKLIPLGG